MKKTITILLAALLALALTACKKEEPPEVPPTPPAQLTHAELRFTEETMPHIDGSTAAIPLCEAVYSVLLGKDRSDCESLVNFSGTNEAYMNLARDYTDTNIIFAYEPPADALAYLETYDVELEMAPIGRDALVFLVNVKNPVQNLSTKQIIDIYQGKIKNWKEVGGSDTKVKPFQRNETSGSQTLMRKLVMGGKPLMEAPKEYIETEMGGLVDAIATYNNSDYAIGYNVYYYVSQMKDDEQVTMLSVDGVLPSNESIQSGSYPFVNDFYAAIRKDAPENSPERQLFEWIQSAEGQALIAGEGYVSYR